MIPHRTPFFLPLLYPSLTWRISTAEKVLFLTFDDGPITGPTEYVLETLARYNVPATFFCIGDNIRRYPMIFNQIIKAGHTIGNHTFNHLNGWTTKNVTYVENIVKCNEEMHRHSNKEIRLFRPPYGRISRQQIKHLENYEIVMWDVLSRDYDKNLSAEKCLKNTINAVRQGSIIVFHDSFKAERNMMFSLPRFIEYFLEKGFHFKALANH